jgi:DNA (cytosine-5)-methyltransferase 1
MNLPGFYEFFCGGGMARAGLGARWTCLFANDLDARKGRSYVANWGPEALRIADVAALTTADLPGWASLAWASFPCQDLSLAGPGAGLGGSRSGAFWPFWRLMQSLGKEQRAPRLIVLENVCGALTSDGGRDFAAIAEAVCGGGYRFGALVIDAVHFVPQSRPRLFIVALAADAKLPANCAAAQPDSLWHSAAVCKAQRGISDRARAAWVWWRLPHPPLRNIRLEDVLEDPPSDVVWHTAAQTSKLVGIMSPLHRAKLANAARSATPLAGALFRRTRVDELGVRRQRAEVRFDGIAGCLRTPAGGSSRQVLIVARGDKVRSRLLSGREAARLMGLPEEYKLPARANETLHLLGDGVAAPAVRHLAENLLWPLATAERLPSLAAAE